MATDQHLDMHSGELLLLHRIRVGGVLAGQPPGAEALVRRGWLELSATGALLTDAGCVEHERVLDIERQALDIEAIRREFARYWALEPDIEARCAAADMLRDEDGLALKVQVGLIRQLAEQGLHAVERTAQDVPRFAEYARWMRDALIEVERGRREFLRGSRVRSFLWAWTACHDDYLLTLGHIADGEDA